MKTCLSILAACILFVAAASAQAPVVGGLANNYSYIAAGLPNYGIAQGSIFDIFGTNLVSTNLSLQSVPLQSTQNGVTVNVTVGSTTTHPYLYSMFHGSPDEIAAVLPSTTPVGNGTLTVTTSAGTSATFPIVVVQSAFGILTLNQYGSGMGAVQDYNDSYNLRSLTNSAKPGDILVLWGTGLGPVTADESQAQQQADFGSNFPIEVDIGGVSAAIAYHGRSVYPGLDEVIFTVPQNVSGCSVSIVVLSKNNKLVSNVVSVPVAANGGACSDPTAGGVTPAVYQKCATSGCTIGDIGISKTTSTTQSTTIQTPIGPITTPGSTTVNDAISGEFYRYTPAQFATGIYGPSAVSIGSCSVYTFSYTGQTTPTIPTGATATPLNAGTITATTPNTTASMPYKNGFYSTSGTGGTLIPASGGSFSFANGSGGPDIGTLSGAQITLGPPLVWDNPPTSVTRSSGITANWHGGTSGSTVVLTGYSLAFAPDSTTSYVAAFFWCSAPVSAGSITVPATVLLALPASGSLTESGISIPLPGAVSLGNGATPVTFTAPNLDFGYLSATTTTTESVVFQ